MLSIFRDLPAVDSVEVIVLALGGDVVSRIRQQSPNLSPEKFKAHLLAQIRSRDSSLDELSGVPVEDELAQEIASLWRQLPYAEQMRCHTPPFALRFRSGKNTLIASICWHCNNIWIIENGERKYAQFDGQADVSQRLLRLLESIANARQS